MYKQIPTIVEAVLQRLDDGRATTETINAFFLVRFLRLQVLDAPEYNGWEARDLRDVQGLLQAHAENSPGYVDWGIGLVWKGS